MSDVVLPEGGHEDVGMGLSPPGDLPNKPITITNEGHEGHTSEIVTAVEGGDTDTESSAPALNKGSREACDTHPRPIRCTMRVSLFRRGRRRDTRGLVCPDRPHTPP